MNEQQFIYSFKYDYHHSNLCKLESRQLFGKEEYDKTLFSSIKINPSISPFIKNRFLIRLEANDYDALLSKIKDLNIQKEGFKVEYLSLENDTLDYDGRLQKCRDIGFIIHGEPNYDAPSVIYSLCYHDDKWYFGELTKHNTDWVKHKKKPCSFSNSISVHIAKSLVNITTKGDQSVSVLDGCCGVGTVLLEGKFAQYNIQGADINWKAVKHSRENLSHFGYDSIVHKSDIADITQQYGAVIIDLPYNLYTQCDDVTVAKIVKAAANISDRIVIVSITDISSFIEEAQLEVVDKGIVEKRGKTKFTRTIWVCEKA